jgi:DDE superfamily endonuclease
MPRVSYTRKGFYALPIQARVDAKYKFRFMSRKVVGSTHDILAWSVSGLSKALAGGSMIPGYWIAADAAYSCTEYMLTPYSKSQLVQEGFQSSRSAFNFYQSSHRVHVEQAFGLLVRRLGILWRPMRFDLPRVPLIVAACMRLHNWCLDKSGLTWSESGADEDASEMAFKNWWSNAAELREISSSQQGSRSDQTSTLRDNLRFHLDCAGLMRPVANNEVN